jgi:integrase
MTSVNSTMRQARSIFAEKVLRHLPEVPRPHLFQDVEFEPRTDTRFFGCGVDAPTLMRLALQELSERPEELKAFILAIALGLRRREADLLEWSSFDFAACTVEVRPTEHYGLKTKESSAVMALDPEFIAMFKEWHAQRHGSFVLESDHLPRPDAGYHYYRCDATCGSLVDWLRLQGVTGNKPLHAMRKLFGSLVVGKAGIFAASSA